MSQAVDLCHLAQESPFRNVEAAGPSVPAQESVFENTRAARPYVPSKTFDFFQTIVVPVVVRNTPRMAQENAATQPSSNATTVSGSTSYPNPQPPQFKSMWKKTVRLTISHIFAVLILRSQLHTSSPIQNIQVKVSVRTQHSSLPRQNTLRQNTTGLGPAFLDRLQASMTNLENMDQDLKSIEKAQREGMEELKELGQRVENIHLELTRQNAS
jgi:hypothetical protein